MDAKQFAQTLRGMHCMPKAFIGYAYLVSGAEK